MSFRALISSILVFLSLLSLLASAEIPKVINYQGKLTDDTGATVPDGPYPMMFTIYDTETGGTSQWSSGILYLIVMDGIFSVLLGDAGQSPLELPFQSDYWLEVVVDTDVQSPRVRLGSVGYAYMANNLMPGAAVVGDIRDGTLAALKGTNIATSDPTSGVMGEAESPDGHGVYGLNTSGMGEAIGVKGQTLSANGVGVFGLAISESDSGCGVEGRTHSSYGRGVFGEATATFGKTYGGYFRCDAPMGAAVYGEATCTAAADIAGGFFVSASDYGVYGKSMDFYGGCFESEAVGTGGGVIGSGGIVGVTGLASSSTGIGIEGRAEASITGTACGVYGSSMSSDGFGVKGYVTATVGSGYGVYGEVASYAGTGVCGKVTGTSGSGDGVYGETAAIMGDGVHGKALSTIGQNTGVFGENASTQGIGVLGDAYATTGETCGVWGQCASDSGIGVMGWSSATEMGAIACGGWFESASSSGAGVVGKALQNGNGVEGKAIYGYGVFGGSDESHGIWGESSGGTKAGVVGVAKSTTGSGVAGYAQAYAGPAYGVLGSSVSAGGIGVYGVAHATGGQDSATGGWFYNDSPFGDAVCGLATSSTFGSNACGGSFTSSSDFGAGVYGYSSGHYGVMGISANNAGGYFADESGSYAGVGIGSYKIYGTGSVSFVQNHPENDGEVIVYAAPEGNEVATYVRGRARLQYGEAQVELDDTFKWVTNPDIGLTAHLTPRGVAVPLAVVSLTTEELVVRGPPEGPADIVFDYIVYGLRIGFEEQSIVQKKTQNAPIPSMRKHVELYNERPDLRYYNSLERFKTMRERIGVSVFSDVGRAQSLIQAVGQGHTVTLSGCPKTRNPPRMIPLADKQNPSSNRSVRAMHSRSSLKDQ